MLVEADAKFIDPERIKDRDDLMSVADKFFAE